MFSPHRFCIRSQTLSDNFFVVHTPWWFQRQVKFFRRSHTSLEKKYEIFFGWNLFAWVLLRWSRRHLRTRGAGLEEIFWGLHATFSRAASSPLMYHSPSEILTCELFAWKPERCEGGLGSGKKFFQPNFLRHMNLIRATNETWILMDAVCIKMCTTWLF